METTTRRTRADLGLFQDRYGQLCANRCICVLHCTLWVRTRLWLERVVVAYATGHDGARWTNYNKSEQS